MSPLAKLLQIEQAKKPQKSFLRSVWANFVGILRATKFQRREKRLEVVERITLSNKQSVVLMRLDEREFMVGCCGDSVVLLAPPQSQSMPANAIQAQIKKRRRAKTIKVKAVQPVLAAPVPVVTTSFAVEAEPVKAARAARKAKAVPQIESPLAQRVPTKARLVKAFAGRV